MPLIIFLNSKTQYPPSTTQKRSLFGQSTSTHSCWLQYRNNTKKGLLGENFLCHSVQEAEQKKGLVAKVVMPFSVMTPVTCLFLTRLYLLMLSHYCHLMFDWPSKSPASECLRLCKTFSPQTTTFHP